MANYTLQSHGGEGLYMTADGTPTARRNVYIKARVSDSLDQTWRIDSPSNGARTRTFLGHIGIILFGFTYGVIIGMNTMSPVHSSTSSRIAPSVTSCFKRLYSK